jgi:dolichol-phosphate mannosyltransferase
MKPKLAWHDKPGRNHMGADRPFISVVVPAHNEAENLAILLPLLKTELAKYGSFEIIVVDDGSSDDTLEFLQRTTQEDPRVQYVSLSRNFGHQTALRAGLSYAGGKCAISMDADLQHPVELVPVMIDKWRSGYDIVLTIRENPSDMPWLKRVTSNAFYKVLNWLSEIRIDPRSADFRLLDRKVLDVVNSLTEASFFLRGIVPWLGFRVCMISYVPGERMRGATKYSLRRMISLALTGIVSSSIRPLRVAAVFAAVVATAAALYAIYAVAIVVVLGRAVPGWTSVVLVVSVIGSLQLLILGIIGEYLGQTFREVRMRPNFIVATTSCARLDQ